MPDDIPLPPESAEAIEQALSSRSAEASSERLAARLPPSVVEAFKQAIITAFAELYQLEALVEESLPDEDSPSSLEVNISASVRLMRKQPGLLVIELPSQTAARLAERYLPMESRFTPDLIADAAGELANVVAGQAKTMLKGTPYHYTITTPQVTGHASRADSPTDFVAAVQSEVGCAWIRIALSPCPGS